MSAKFTPGPWDKIVKMDGFTAVGANTLIARVYSTAFKDVANEEANAHLIAAAPDLYEALRSIESHWGDPQPLETPAHALMRFWQAQYLELQAIARAALRKADGEDQPK